MDYSAQNIDLWSAIIQIGIIAVGLLLANILRKQIPFVRKSLMPIAVITGFIFLILKSCGLELFDPAFLEMITYHGIAIGFIALSLRVQNGTSRSSNKTALKSGALIVSTYLIQGIIGLALTIGLAYTFMPSLFKAAGLLLPMGYGQGPGQANNIGSLYETYGFFGGQSFGLSLAAAGYVCACVVGVIYLNIITKKNKRERPEHNEISGSVTIDTFQDENEIPVAESIDKFSIQVALVMLVYLITYLVTWGLTSLLDSVAPGISATVSPLLWGFNFIIASAIAILTKQIIKGFRKANIMKLQYQNNYLLSRISGIAFDVMIVAGIASINISDLSGLWIPFICLSVAGGIITMWYLSKMCKKIYPEYQFEALVSMFGMLTGTISSGVLLLREIDPSFKTPAANNLVLGSSYGIIFGAPLLVLLGLAARSDTLMFVTFGIIIVYFALLVLLIKLLDRKASPAANNSDVSDKS